MKKVKRSEVNQFSKENWEEEMDIIKSCIMQQNVLSQHILERMEERNVSVLELATALMNGQITEGFDVGDYPNEQNPYPIRSIRGTDSQGRQLHIGVATNFKGTFPFVQKLTTVYVVEEVVTTQTA